MSFWIYNLNDNFLQIWNVSYLKNKLPYRKKDQATSYIQVIENNPQTY